MFGNNYYIIIKNFEDINRKFDREVSVRRKILSFENRRIFS